MTSLSPFKRWLPLLAMLLALGVPASAIAQDAGGAKEQAQRQLTQPGNNAPMWRDVREGVTPNVNPYQTTQYAASKPTCSCSRPASRGASCARRLRSRVAC